MKECTLQEDILSQLDKAIQAADKSRALELVQQGLALGMRATDLVEQACIPAMRHLGDLWEEGEIFLPELMLSAETMKAVMAILTPKMAAEQKDRLTSARVVIGTVQGDIHDIGKSLVAAMLEAAGFQVRDLGANVPLERFCNEADDFQAHLVCLSALLTTTMVGQKKVIDLLAERKLRERIKVMVGGAPVSRRWAEEIGADGYGENAIEAVRVARQLTHGN
jgi:corrinoid protein of di/trimethylamine methyltransferase